MLFRSGRVAFHDGDEELASGLGLRLVGGHTPGLQIATVATRRGQVVVASDALHFFANKQQGIPFAILVDVPEYIAGWQKLDALAESPDHIIPGHDPAILATYPVVKPGLEGVAVRLDTMPKAIQVMSVVVPARYFVSVVKDVFLKGLGLKVIWAELVFLAIYATIVFLLSVRKMNQKVA